MKDKYSKWTSCYTEACRPCWLWCRFLCGGVVDGLGGIIYTFGRCLLASGLPTSVRGLVRVDQIRCNRVTCFTRMVVN
ncbi:MAG: hypothetical protein LBJ00_06445 [Planctomycetaceae bacterium]|nr:hypothetical protein [Planctomycetaceae bacterium]